MCVSNRCPIPTAVCLIEMRDANASPVCPQGRAAAGDAPLRVEPRSRRAKATERGVRTSPRLNAAARQGCAGHPEPPPTCPSTPSPKYLPLGPYCQWNMGTVRQAMLSRSDSLDEATGLSSGLSLQRSKGRNMQDHLRCWKRTRPATALARGAAEPPVRPAETPQAHYCSG